MDGDVRQYRHNEQSQFPSTFRMGRRAVPGPSAGATDRFRQANTLSTARGDATELSQAPGRAPLPSYVGYGYTDTSLQGTSLQPGSQLQQFSQGFPPSQRPQQQEENAAYPYGQEIAYNFHQQQSPTQGPYDAVPQYPARQSVATIDALSDQFPVPQYFPAGEPTEAAVAGMVSPYMSSHLPHSASYNYSGFMGRSSATAQSFPTSMASLTNPVGTTMGRLEQQQQQQQQPPQQHQRLQPQPQSQPVAAESTTAAAAATNLDEAYRQFQRALRGILDHSRAGRLVEASRSLLEISEWLVTNARELGILRDDENLHRDKLRLWNDFNICWLSVFQMQKDLTQGLLQTGHQTPHVSLLDTKTMEQMGKDLVQLCDRLEEHGLVDYQMGVWEEEILSVLGQCLDMMEYRQEMLSSHPLTATATATSRS